MNISPGHDSIYCDDFTIGTTKHLSITGIGRSTLLVNIFIEQIRQGNGGLVIVPHRATADRIAKLTPTSRMRVFI